MKANKDMKFASKLVAAMLVGAVGTGLYSVDAAGLAGSYVGIGTKPTDATVVTSGAEYKANDIIGKNKLIDYRQTKRFNKDKDGNEILEDFSRVATNDNKNGEGVDGTSTANDSKNGVGTTAIGLGTYAARDYATAVGTYASAISGSTSVGSGAYASQYSAAFGRNTYANSKGVAVGDAARATDGLAIGIGASAGEFYKYIQSDGTQNYGAIINSIAIGPNATAVGGTAIGAKAQTNSLYGVALGQGSKVSYNGVALGVGSEVTLAGNGGVALGTYSVANRGAGTIGYMPLVDGVNGEVAANDSRLAEVMGLSDDIKNFTTKYATEISEYNQLNKNYSEIDAKKEEQKNIMIATKGNDDAAYQAAKTEYDKLSKDAVAATNARNAWTAAHQEFTQAMAEQQSALAVFKATDGAVSVGSDAYVDAKTGKTIQNTRQIINVAAGTEDTDAVNVAQLKHVADETAKKANIDASNITPDQVNKWQVALGIDNLTSDVSGLQDRVNGLDNRVNKLDERVDKVGAGAAALAGLHPLEFNPDDKFSASVAMGSYKGQGAAALGGFYRPNADTMFSVSSTIGEDPMFNIGLSLKFGQKGDDIYRNANATNIGALTSEVNSLKAENKGLADQVASQKAELEQQRALIQQLMVKVGM
ncbi:YadA-like family protein [Veillonella sp.]|uniref:YadA-like family protein n=1 Tax=Veillonella sp. TaxID=1926307 RepID=UPI0025DF00C8|nr:YadA-like family protein [Veillonella sp.]